MPSSHCLPPSCHWFSRLASALDLRSAPRLAWLFVGAILARGRRTVTSWIRAAGLSGEFRPCTTALAAALWTVPGPRRPGQRGRPRVHGERRIDLAKRAGQRRGWVTATFTLYGKSVVKRYKTFAAVTV